VAGVVDDDVLRLSHRGFRVVAIAAALMAVLIVGLVGASSPPPHFEARSSDPLSPAGAPGTFPRQGPPGSKPGYDPTVALCTGNRAREAVLYGVGPVCAPWDSIPAIDAPTFQPADDVDFVAADEPVIALDLAGEHRAYPVQILVHHEIVNDVVGGEPVVVTFCPLCDSAVAFSRRVDHQTLRFGVSGQLNFANLLMFDRETFSLWRQLTGQAVEGPLEGVELRMIPVRMVPFEAWAAAHPVGLVLDQPKGTAFHYGVDPYHTYAIDPYQTSFAVRDLPVDPRLPPKWRVVGVATQDGSVAFPSPARRFAVVESAHLGRTRLVAFFQRGVGLPETTYLLEDAPRGWAGVVWKARLAGQDLRFVVRHGRFVERTTGSVFSFFGRGLRGPLKGFRLRRAPQVTAFWFAWSEFYPRTSVAQLPAKLRPAPSSPST
jgi:hypothetical protein